MSVVCASCRESVSPLYRCDGEDICLDCKIVWEEGSCHRWDQIREISLERKMERRRD